MTAPMDLSHLVGPKEDTLNKTWKQDKSSFGYKMLMKMGWSDGQGLGKDLQGASTHVTVQKRTDTTGLGAVQDNHGNLGWAVASASFDSVLSQLNARYGASKDGESSEKKKKSKKEKKSKSSMLLRHPKLLKSKDISKYSAHDLSAILGVKTVKDEEQPAVVAEKEEGEGVQQEERKKSKKRRRAEVAEEEDAQVVSPASEAGAEEEDEEEKRRRRKKEKKEKKRLAAELAKLAQKEQEEDDEAAEEEAVKEKKSKKKKRKQKE